MRRATERAKPMMETDGDGISAMTGAQWRQTMPYRVRECPIQVRVQMAHWTI